MMHSLFASMMFANLFFALRETGVTNAVFMIFLCGVLYAV
jgi:hypothetical protein